MKIAIFVATLLAVCNAQSNHMFWGQAGPSDTRIVTQHVYKDYSFLGTVETEVKFPLPGYINDRLVSAVFAYDQKTNGNGGPVSITSGGINATSVTVNFRSLWNQGIDFILEIYVR